MTLRSFSMEKCQLEHEGNLYVVHLHRRFRDGMGAMAAFVALAPRGLRVPAFAEDKVAKVRRSLFGKAARRASVRLGTLRELAGKPDWRPWWKERPVKVPATKAAIDAVLVARSLSCVPASDDVRVRLEVLVYPKGAEGGYASAGLRIVGADWMVVVASRTPGRDPEAEPWRLWRVKPRQKKSARTPQARSKP